MIPIHTRRRVVSGVVSSVLAVGFIGVAGCGGGNSTSSHGTGGGGQQNQSSGTVFHVDLATREVTVVPPAGHPSGKLDAHALVGGNTVTFNSSQLLDVAGDAGVKSLSVSLTNHWGLPIGTLPNGTATGLRVVFSSFTNQSSFPNIESQSQVATLAGSGSAGSADGYLTSATFSSPRGCAVDASNNTYIADFTSNKIRKINNGLVSTVAGSGSAGTANGLGKVATFNGPWGIAYNTVDGALYVADNTGNDVRRITLAGQVSTVAGTGSAGESNGTSGSNATFNGPEGVAVDSSGNIYVADVTGNTVRKIAYTGSDRTLATSYTVTTVVSSGLSSPAGIAVDSYGAVYIAGSGNNKIQRVDSAGDLTTIAGTGTGSESDGDGSSATFNGPTGIAAVNGGFVVSDATGNVIRELFLRGNGASTPSDPTSWQVASIAGTGSSGSNNGTGDVATFSAPSLIAVDKSGNVIVTDSSNNLLRKVSPNNGFFPIGVTSGSAPSELVRLSNPTGDIDGSNAPYIAYAGSLASGATSSAQNWNFVIPSGVTAFSFTVNVEADTTALTPPGGTSGSGSTSVNVRTLAGSSSGFKDGAGSLALFSGPKYVASDASGNLYVSDNANYALRRISPSGQVSTIAGVVGTGAGSGPADGQGNVAVLAGPTGVAVSLDGTAVYFGDGNTVRCASIASGADATLASNWYVATIAGQNGTAGKTDGDGTTALFDVVSGCALDSGGNVYAAESTGNRVRRIQFRGGDPTLAVDWQVSTFAGDNSATAGASGSTNATGTSARFNAPMGLATDTAGNVYVADSGNNKVRMITPAAVVTTFAGSGTAGHVDSATAASVQFNSPRGITLDSSDYVYVTDFTSDWVRRVSQSGATETVAGTGSSGTANGTGNAATFASPQGIAVSPSGNLYVCDTATDNAVRLIQPIYNVGTN